MAKKATKNINTKKYKKNREEEHMLPFYPGDHLYGNPGSNIGLCTLWSPKNKYTAQLSNVFVIGNLYSNFGIGLLVRNVLATPQIRHIIITGTDCPEPNQRQAERLLHRQLDATQLLLTEDHLNLFYARVTLHDARSIGVRKQPQLSAFITGLPPAPPIAMVPIQIPLPDVKQETYPTARNGHIVRANSIKSAHLKLIHEIRRFGQFTNPDSEGHFRQELWQLMVCLSPECTPFDTPLYSPEEISRYGEALWVGNEPADLTYRYGHTMRYRYGDQIEAAINAFQLKPETFRVVISLWEPLQSLLRDDEPCLITLQPRIRNGFLDMFAYIRTNDMFKGWPENAGGLRYFQQRFVEALKAAKILVEIGELTIVSGSAHIYDYQFSLVGEYLKQSLVRGIQFDPKGDWRLGYDKKLFFAEHYKDGQLLQVLRASTLNELARQIIPFVSDISHALFLGKELEKLGLQQTQE